MNNPSAKDLSVGKLTYIKGIGKHLPAEAIDVVRKAFMCEASWTTRILETPSCSKKRSELMKSMNDDIHKWSVEIDRVFGRKLYFGGEKPNEKAAESIERLCSKGRCLEIGCGGGSLCWGLALHGWKVLGIDLVEESSWPKIVKETIGGAKFNVVDINITDVNQIGSDYDLIIMEECLEHFPPGDYEEVLRKVFNLLKSGGVVCLVVPNALVGPFDVSQYFVERGKKAQGGHFNERRMKEIAKDLSVVGFHRMKSVAYGGLAAGRRFGWSRSWYIKARVCEALFQLLPPKWRWRKGFAYLVPPVIAAFKP